MSSVQKSTSSKDKGLSKSASKSKESGSTSKSSKSKDASKQSLGKSSSTKPKSDKPKDLAKTTSSKSKDQKPGPSQPPKPKKVKAPPKQEKAYDDWGLAESDEDDDEYSGEEREIEEKQELKLQTSKDEKKLAQKARLAKERQLQMKRAALRDDDNVFDVSYEGQGKELHEQVFSATDIKVSKMTIRAAGKTLLDSTDLTIAQGRKYGLVGPNGMGKSTLLRLLARRQIPVPPNLDVLLVEQEVQADERSALQAVVEADFKLQELRKEDQELVQLMNDEQNDDKLEQYQTRHAEVCQEMDNIGGASAEARAAKILSGLGFTKVMQGRSTQSFSGGWRMRISLARALFIQPTLLLLDEPTNHLDLRAVLWLEEYLTRWKKTLVIVSHDRNFLNSVTTDIIHLHDQQLDTYRGNFAAFEEMYEQKRQKVNNEYELYQRRMKAAKQSGNKQNQKKVNDNSNRKKDKQTKSQRDAAFGAVDSAETAKRAPTRWNDYNVCFTFPEPPELPSPLIQLIDANFKYPGRDDFGMSDMNIGVHMESRVAIVGPNGAGKSTLMNLLAGDLEPTDGENRRSHKLRIGRYAQHFVDLLAMEDTPVEYLMSKYPQSGLTETDMRAKLGKFGLSGHHHLQPICKLSGGQKARVVFASISLMNAHILLLDEPTNHLDMQSIDALSEALQEYSGGVIVISHDSELLGALCEDSERSEVWVVEDGKIRSYPGDFEDYKDELTAEIQRELDED